MARAHRLSGVRRGRRGRTMGQDSSGMDWSQILTTGIQTAGNVAAIAVRPPTYSSVMYPSGAQSVTSFGSPSQTASMMGGIDFTSLLSSPLILLGGLALVAVFALKR